MFGGRNPQVKFPGGKFMRINCLGVIVPDGKHSGAKVQGGFPKGQLPGGYLFQGNCSGVIVGEKFRGITVVGGDFMVAIVQVGSCPGVNVRIP